MNARTGTLLGLLLLLAVLLITSRESNAQIYGREIQKDLEFERHVNIFADGDTITCLIARDYTGMAMACDWK